MIVEGIQVRENGNCLGKVLEEGWIFWKIERILWSKGESGDYENFKGCWFG